MSNQHLSATLTEHLQLASPPVGICFVDAPPEGAAEAGEGIASTCTMWRRAEEGVFYAAAERHFNCPVGAMVMGFELPQEVQAELMGLVGAMAEARYFDPAEAAGLPYVTPSHRGILYGRLDQLPGPADLVLCWVDPAQAMLVAEAVGTSLWTGDTGVKAFGRPGCAALPVALGEGEMTLSLGCAGMRVYTEVADGAMLLALPLAEAEKLALELPRITEANQGITAFHRQRKQALAATAS